MKPLLLLLYTSQSRRTIDESLVQEILVRSRKLNERDQITGFLTARSDRFLQVLEGPEAVVRTCYARICRDDRHTRVSLRGETHIDTRLFADWKMGWVADSSPSDLTEAILTLFESANEGIAADSASIEAMLRIFSKDARIVD